MNGSQSVANLASDKHSKTNIVQHMPTVHPVLVQNARTVLWDTRYTSILHPYTREESIGRDGWPGTPVLRHILLVLCLYIILVEEHPKCSLLSLHYVINIIKQFFTWFNWLNTLSPIFIGSLELAVWTIIYLFNQRL